MAITSASTQRVVLSDGSINAENSRARSLLGSASPIIIGLSFPLMMMLLIDPVALRHAHFLAFTLLVPMLLVSVAIYIFSVFHPGDLAGLVADAEVREVELLQANIFATRRTRVPFEDIASVKLASIYDADGYPSERGEIELFSGDRILLPASFGGSDVAALRNILKRR